MLHLSSSKGRHWTEVASLAYRRHQRRLLLHLHGGGEEIVRKVENNERKEEKEVTELRKNKGRGRKQRILDRNQVSNLTKCVIIPKPTLIKTFYIIREIQYS